VLARWLRTQRQHCGHTYTVLAERTGYHTTTLQRAADGYHVPTWPVVQAYAAACHASPHAAAQLWRMARAGRPTHTSDIRPRRIHDADGLVTAMIELRNRAGQPSLRDLERMAGGLGRLPRSTLQLILAKRSFPTREQLIAFLTACGAREKSFAVWEQAWERASGARGRVPNASRLFRQNSPTDDVLRRVRESQARSMGWPGSP
jgi:Helix-turn-helix domain